MRSVRKPQVPSMLGHRQVLFTCLVTAGVLLGSATARDATDLHAFWDQRCHDCYGHAGDFARRYLRVEKGQLTGRHHATNLRSFLAQHEMSDPATAGRIYAMLLAQAQTPSIYQQKCAGCHKTAAELARSALVERDGEVYGKANGQRLSEFLQRHGRLAPDEVAPMLETLRRVLKEVGGAG